MRLPERWIGALWYDFSLIIIKGDSPVISLELDARYCTELGLGRGSDNHEMQYELFFGVRGGLFSN